MLELLLAIVCLLLARKDACSVLLRVQRRVPCRPWAIAGMILSLTRCYVVYAMSVSFTLS